MSGAIAKRYAKALFEIVAQQGALDSVEQELTLIRQALNDNPAFVQLLHHPQIDKQVKKQEFTTIFGGVVSQTMVNFMSLLIDNNREEHIEDILDSFVRFANKERGLEDAYVTSIQPLTDAEKEEIASRFSQIINKKIRIHNVVDPAILGGVIVKIGDRLFDGSVVGKLNRFKRRVETTIS